LGIKIADHPSEITDVKVSDEHDERLSQEPGSQRKTKKLKQVLNPTVISRELIIRANRIRQQHGTIGLLKGVFGFLVYPFYKRTPYYLYENQVSPEYGISESLSRIDTKELYFRVVTSNQEADKLEAEGYNFRKYPTEHNHYLTLYTKWLDCGAIAFCTFVEKEFAAICWILPSQKAQDAVKAPPLKVDYANHEVMDRGLWVNPKYRGTGLLRYTTCNRDRFLRNTGITLIRTTVDYSNQTGKGVEEALGARQYGRARALKILWLRFWKESCQISKQTHDNGYKINPNYISGN
jgi:hypothetical protein